MANLKNQDLIQALNQIAKKAAAKATYEDVCLSLLKTKREDLGGHLSILTCAQLMRDADVLPPEITFYLIASSVEHLADQRRHVVYCDGFSGRFEKIREAHGILQGDDFLDAEEPLAYRNLSEEFAQVCDQITVTAFQYYGENEIADLYENNRPEFDRRLWQGREAVLGPFPPDLKQHLIRTVA